MPDETVGEGAVRDRDRPVTMQIAFRAPETVGQFMQSEARRRVIMGPVGSGKSSGCVIEIVRRAAMQKRDPGGKRRTRFAVIRNTMPQLKDTTIKTFLSWCPHGVAGTWMETSKTFLLKFDDVECEVMFRALDDLNDVKKLLSLELTGAYVNECREVQRDIIEGLDGRIGRYPSVKDGGCSWRGIFADTNAPEEDSYWHRIVDGLDPDTGVPMVNGWTSFQQPAAMVRIHEPGSPRHDTMVMNPAAENVENLDPGYYENQVVGKKRDWIKVYIESRFGTTKSGQPVHPLFNEEFHIAKEHLIPNPHLPLIISADFGLTPAMTVKQQDPFGRVMTFDEIVTEGMGLERCIQTRLKPLLRRKYDGYQIRVTGDPAGNTKSQNDEKSCVQVFKKEGFKDVKFAWSNNPVHRMGATDTFLMRMTEMGPAYLVDPRCSYLKRGLKGAYHFKMRKNGAMSDEVEKDIYSHVCFTAETPISTPFGAIQISKIKSGDLVSTPLGPRRAVAAFSRVAEVVTYQFVDRVVECTPDHPSWTPRGYVAIDLLKPDDIVVFEGNLGWKILFWLWHYAGRPNGRSTSFAASSLPRGAVQRLTTKAARAAFVVLRFLLTGTHKRKHAHLPVAGRLRSRQRVYNIEVEQAHCYYANGLLVSNCEANQYGDMHFERGTSVNGDRDKRIKDLRAHLQQENRTRAYSARV